MKEWLDANDLPLSTSAVTHCLMLGLPTFVTLEIRSPLFFFQFVKKGVGDGSSTALVFPVIQFLPASRDYISLIPDRAVRGIRLVSSLVYFGTL